MEIKEIQNERQGDYGDAKESHQAIADSWSVYLSRKFRTKIELEAKDVAILMVLFKSMREAYKHKYDNLLDMASYADFAKKFCEDTIQDIHVPTNSSMSLEDDKQLCEGFLEVRTCTSCYYRCGLTESSAYVCKKCVNFSNWTPCNVPSEVPYDREPQE